VEDTWTRTLSVTMFDESDAELVATLPEDISESPGRVDAGDAEGEDDCAEEADLDVDADDDDEDDLDTVAVVVIVLSSSSSSSSADWMGLTRCSSGKTKWNIPSSALSSPPFLI